MRKLYLMLMLASVLPALAGGMSRISVSPEPVSISHRDFVMRNQISLPKSVAAVAGSDQIITAPPADAEIRTYTRTSSGYSVRWGMAYQENDEGIVGEMAFCQNGDVYLKNPVSFYITDSWIKGKQEGSRITFGLPQLVAVVPADEEDESGEVMEVWLNVVKSDYDSTSLTFEFDESIANEITMTVGSDGSITYSEEMTDAVINSQEFSLPKKMMALTMSNHAWLGYGDYNNVYEPFDEKPLYIPENLESLDYAMTFGEEEKNGKWVKVAFDDTNSKLYISGIYTPSANGFRDLAKSAITGTILDGGVMVESRQYIGVDQYYYHTYISGGSVVSEGGGAYLDIEDNYFMTMDAKRSKLITAATMVVSEGEGYVLDFFYYPVFDAQDGYIDPNPAEPLVTGFMPYTPQYGYGGVRVQIPNTNKNGQLLREEDLSYSIIINDKQIIFEPENYPEFSEPTVWIPFNFSSYNVEIDQYTINTRMVFMTEELLDVNTISVQSRYKDKDTYYVTNGQTYLYKLPKFEAPVFDPESGHAFPGATGEVTITAPEDAVVSYRIITEDSGNVEFVDSESNVVDVEITQNCFIQAFSKDPEGDDERSSDVATATYTVNDSSVPSIVDDPADAVEIYTIEGVRVSRENRQPGLYIIKSAKSGKATRVLVK